MVEAGGEPRTVSFGVLGPMTVRVGNVDVDPGPPQHRAVLAALLLDVGRVVDAHVITDRVWGGQQYPTASAALQVCISKLRKRLTVGEMTGAAVILTQSPGYRLAAEATAVDAVRFVDLLGAARRATAEGHAPAARELVGDALGLWRGRPFADVDADFVTAEVSRLTDQRLAATELAAELDLTLGHHLELGTTLPSLVDAHPLREGLRASLMTAWYRSGRQADALRLYDDARRRLGDELGVDPGPELQRLHALILRQDPVLDSPEPRAPVTSVAVQQPADRAGRPNSTITGPPDESVLGDASAGPDQSAADRLVGRDDELRVLLDAAAASAVGVPVMVAVYGEAGIGKTRLVTELQDRSTAHDAVFVWGHSFDRTGSAPYWPWAQALSGIARAVGPEQVAAALDGEAAYAAVLLGAGLVPPGVPQPPPVAPESGQTKLFDAVVVFLHRLAQDRHLTVALEDLHWADQGTVDLTEHVATRVQSGRILVVLTIRNPSEMPDSLGQSLLAGVSRAPRAIRIPLSGLDTAQVRAYAGQRLGTELAPAAAERLRARTDGNPFFIAELVRLLTEERELSERADVPVPTTVRAVIERRLRHLDRGDRDLLSAASVIGRTFDARVLADVLGRPPVELGAALDRAETAGVVTPAGHTVGRYRFTHALVQETLLLGTGPMRRAALHSEVADALERSHIGAMSEIAHVLAHHHGAAGAVGDPEKHVHFLLLAADRAVATLAFSDAERHLRLAVTAVAAIAGTSAQRYELQARVQLGSLLSLTRGYNDPAVAQERSRALVLAAQTGSSEHLMSALWGLWGNALVSGDFDTAAEHARAMADAAERTRDPMLSLAHHHALGQVRYHQGELAEALQHLQKAADLADRHPDQVRLDIFLQHPAVASRGWQATVLALLGRVPESDEVGRRAQSLAQSSADPFTNAYLHILEGWRSMFLNRPALARSNGEEASRIAAEHGFGQLAAFSLPSQGWGRAHTGEVSVGHADVQLGIDLFSAVAAGHMFGHVMLGARGEIELLAGDPALAVATADAAVAESGRTGERFYLAAVHLLRARALHAQGADRSAIEDALTAAEQVAGQQNADLFVRRAAQVRLQLLVRFAHRR